MRAWLTCCLVVFGILPGVSANSDEVERVRGRPLVHDGDTISIDGRSVRLAGIAAPPLGTMCLRLNKLEDCGLLARAGLVDLTFGMSVRCRALSTGRFRCTIGRGYDLSVGMIYAGWAVPLGSAPDSYFTNMQKARARELGLWRARFPDGSRGFANSLMR